MPHVLLNVWKIIWDVWIGVHIVTHAELQYYILLCSSVRKYVPCSGTFSLSATKLFIQPHTPKWNVSQKGPIVNVGGKKLKDDWSNVLIITFKVDIQIFSQFSQLATIWGFLTVRGATRRCITALWWGKTLASTAINCYFLSDLLFYCERAIRFW